ncbi:MAG: transposase, partial [Deltaproteobacteria bacterium]|nr:transposase [Deltaproteobacteria bacterium]
QVENAFRTMKSVELRIRPIYHYLDKRVESHIFLTMLAYYVEWHLREAWRELTFNDTDLESKKTRDPVAPAKRSDSAKRKASTKKTIDNLQAQRYSLVLKNLGTIVKAKLTVTLKAPKTEKTTCYEIKTNYTPLQEKAFQLVDEKVPVYP